MRYCLLSLLLPLYAWAAGGEDDWKHYPYQAPGTEIVMPNDEGAHRGIPNMEWWYVVMHLRGESSGHRYAVMVTHFNNRMRFFTVTNLDQKIHTSGAAMGLLKSTFGELNIEHKTKYGRDIFRSKRDRDGMLVPFEYTMETHHEKMNIRMDLKSRKRPLMVAGDGYVTVGASGHSYYYSLTDLEVSGELEHQGRREKVTGKGWMDHQWGPFFVSPFELGNAFETYEWFCVQLENGMELMISNIYDRENRLPLSDDYGGVELILPNGESFHTFKRDFKRTNFWRDPMSGHIMSMGWNLDVPEWGLTLAMRPDMLEQMVQLPLKGSFWEGSVDVQATIAGIPVKGKAFGELLHRFEQPEIEIAHLRSQWQRQDVVSVEWKVTNPDEGNPLYFDVSLLQNGIEKLLVKKATVKHYKAKLDSIIINSAVKKFRIKIRGYSVDGVISSEAETSELHLTM